MSGCFADPGSSTGESSVSETGGGETQAGTESASSTERGSEDDGERESEADGTGARGEGACGDGVVDAGEACDDGNNDETDGCTSLCAAPSCDDGIVSGEESDLDCGGDCEPCEEGKLCTDPADCVTVSCYDGTCVAACTSFAVQMGSAEVDAFYGLARGADGGLYAAGETNGSFDGSSVSQGRDVAFAKYDGEGNEIYARQFGTAGADVALGIAVDASGNLAIGGNTSGSFPGFTIAGATDGFVAVYDENTTQQWVTQLSSGSTDSVEAVAVADDGKVYAVGIVGGTFGGNTSQGGQDVLVAKLDNDGSVLWSRQLGSTANDRGRAVAVAPNGDVVVVGSGSADFQGNTALGDYDVIVARLSSDGSVLWTEQTGTTDWDEAKGVRVGADGAIYLAGSTAGTLAGKSSSGSNDIFVMKYSADGEHEWSSQFGSSAVDSPYGMALDTRGGIYVTGLTEGDLASPAEGEADVFVAALDASGEVQWVFQAGSSASDVGRAIAVGDQGEVFAAGYSFGDLAGSNLGGADVYLSRICGD